MPNYLKVNHAFRLVFMIDSGFGPQGESPARNDMLLNFAIPLIMPPLEIFHLSRRSEVIWFFCG